jgi:hypothetical protein
MGDTKILSMAAVIALLGLVVIVLFGPMPSIAPRDISSEPAGSGHEPVPIFASTSNDGRQAETGGARAEPES